MDPVLDPPIVPVDLNDADGYDALVNACYHPNSPGLAVRETLLMLDAVGFTDKQINAFIRKAKATGINYPIDDDGGLEHVVIEIDAKVKNLQAENQFQNIADKFLLYIYGKKFNDGVHGAFGQAQNILPEARRKMIVIRIPEQCKNFVEGSLYDRKSQRFKSSVTHYRTKGGGDVKYEYY